MTYQIGRTLAQVTLEYGGSRHGDPGTRVADRAGQQFAGGRLLRLAVGDQELAGTKAGRASGSGGLRGGTRAELEEEEGTGPKRCPCHISRAGAIIAR